MDRKAHRMKCLILKVFCAVAVTCSLVALAGCETARRDARSAAQQEENAALKRVLKLRWFDKLPTVGVRAVYVVRDSLYIDTIEGILYRCDRVNGGVVWGSKIQYPLTGRPTRDGSGLLFGMCKGNLIVLDEESGAIIRRRRVHIGPLGTIFPTSEALAYAGTDASIHVISPATGYDMITPERIGANVLSIDSNSEDLLHMVIDPVYEQAYVAAIFSNTGREAWRAPIGPKPLVDMGLYEGLVVVGNTDYYVRAIDSRAGREKWRTPVGGAAIDKPKVSRDRVFVVTDDLRVHCLDANTGKSLWQETPGNCRRFLTADDHYAVAEKRGRRIVVIDAKTGKEIATSLPMQYDHIVADPADGIFCRITRDGHIVSVQTQPPKE